MLSPVGSVTSSAPIPSPFNANESVVAANSQQLQLERQLQLYNQQLAVAQDAARQAEQLQRQIAAVQQQLASQRTANDEVDTVADDVAAEQLRTDQLQADQQRTDQLQTDQQAEDLLAEQLRTDQLLADRQAEDVRADQLAAERLATERLAADRLAADQLDDAQNFAADQSLLRPSTLDANDETAAFNRATSAGTDRPVNDDIIPPLTPDDSGRLVNTQV